MSIVKVQKPERYTTISNVPLNDPGISLRAKGLLCYLLSKPSGWEINVKQLVSAGTDGRDAIYATLKELREAGYVVMTERREAGKMLSYDYTVYEEKQAPDPPLTEKPEAVPLREIPTANGRNNRIGKSPTHSNDLYTVNTEEVNTEGRTQKKSVEKSIQERKNEFKLMVINWHQSNPAKYPKLMLKSFVSYWTEKSIKKKKEILRFEDEEFFELGRRLSTWFQRAKDSEIRLNWECNDRIASLEQLLSPI